MPSEFDLIRQYFTRSGRHTDLGVGDDAALFTPAPGMQLAVSTDMLVSGTHFLPDTDPEDLGWKTLAVNVSDIAAMGGQPRWALLALALPLADEAWIAAFARGLFDCAETFGVDLIGGDTTRGPLNLSVTIFGEVPAGTAITRAGARAGDDIWITGQPGRAALGLAHLQQRMTLPESGAAECIAALQRPQPRVAVGLALRGVASAMLDVSDGLAGDLQHILEQSGVGADIAVTALPLTALLHLGADAEAARAACLSGGDDYELLFTATPQRRDDIAPIAARLGLPMTRIGHITRQPGLRIAEADGRLGSAGGYDHFA
ncbi:MAG: thiamine-phosphate kinase [Pseudazoarcus pumilus]|nr:thiamine-phosphate kinase [Pseudazoarcus pumilus]